MKNFDASTIARLLTPFAAITALIAACATGNVAFEEDNTSTSTSSSSSGSQGGNGEGGATGGQGMGAGDSSPCGIDCATISTPQCQVAQCNVETKQCQIVDSADGTVCDDGKFCSVKEVCTAGICGGGEPNDCGLDPPQCTAVTCDELSQKCSTVPSPNGAACQSTDLCQINTICTNGLCIGTEKDCFFSPVPNECHVAKCNPQNGNCDPEPGNEGQGCIDQKDLCTDGKTCSAGVCVGGGPMDCSSLTVGCFNGVCDSMNGQCISQPVPAGGVCQSAADDCNTGQCDLNGTCQPVPANEGGTCEDGNPCTSGEKCASGQCTGGVMVPQVVYFEEHFADNSKLWTMDSEWQIGPAAASSGQSYGGPDPAQDNTATADNGVAGVVIGGHAAQTIHSYYYLTSPAIDVSQVQGALWFGFYRWLNSDYTNYMQNEVAVYDGQQWVVLWQSGGSPGVQDSSWTQVSFDIAQYKNQNLKVRFGFKIGSSGVFKVSQWNVDDVTVANVICP